MWRVAFVVVIAVLGGCSGVLPSGPSGQSDATRVTPVPVPTSSANVTVPTSDGAVDVDRLLDRHEQALATRSFHRHVERAGPENTLDVWIDRERGVRRVQRRFGPISDDVVLTNDTLYTNVRDDPESPYSTTPAIDNASLVGSPAGVDLLGALLEDADYRQIATTTRNGRPVAVVAADTEPGESGLVRSRLYVDRNGIIRYIEHTERRPDRQDIETVMTVSTATERVPIPWWLEENDPYSSGSM